MPNRNEIDHEAGDRLLARCDRRVALALTAATVTADDVRTRMKVGR